MQHGMHSVEYTVDLRYNLKHNILQGDKMNDQIIKKDVSNIGKNVRKIRKQELNQTQEEFAELIDMSKDTISNIERGQVIPTMICMVRISNATNKSVDSFLVEA